jgi:hypothetical protein
MCNSFVFLTLQVNAKKKFFIHEIVRIFNYIKSVCMQTDLLQILLKWLNIAFSTAQNWIKVILKTNIQMAPSFMNICKSQITFRTVYPDIRTACGPTLDQNYYKCRMLLLYFMVQRQLLAVKNFVLHLK